MNEPVQLELGKTTPRARVTDPRTSHEAAASVKKRLPAAQAAVLFVFREHDPMTDVELIETYRGTRMMYAKPLPEQSDSGLRTRRAELVDLGYIEDSGQRRRLATGRKAIVWRLKLHARSEAA